MSSTSQHPQHWTSRWFSRLKPGAAARRARAGSLDFADYGTAFGLELSLAGSADALPKPPAPVEPDGDTAVAVAVEPKAGRIR